MKLLNRLTVTTVLLAATLAVRTNAEQDQTDDPGVMELEDFVVKGYLYSDQINALKTPTPIIDVPQSLSILDDDEILLRGFNSISDIIEYTPGVTTSQGEGHRDAIVIRGVRSTADFFVDGVRDDVQYYRPLYNLEQIEILRGPNALYFGRGGTGGVVNRVTKKATIDEDFNDYLLSFDTFGATSAQIDSNIVINETMAFRINGLYENLENHRDFFDGERYGITPTFKFLISEKTTLDVSYEYIDHERFIDRGIPSLDGEPADELDGITFGDTDLNNTTLEAHVFRALLQHEFADNLKGNLTASYGTYDKVYQNFFPASPFDPVANTVFLDGYIDSTDRQNAVLSSNIIWETETGGIEHTLLFGGEYINTSSDQDRFNAVFTTSNDDQEEFDVNQATLTNGSGVAGNASTTATFTSENDDTRVDINVFSFSVQDEIQLNEKLDLVLGVRFDNFDFEVDDIKNGDRQNTTDEEFSPRAGIIFKPEENISLYASYSQSFLPKSGEQFADVSADETGLDPDEFINLEAGVKWDLRPGLSLTAAVFKLDEDATEFDGDDDVFFEQSNEVYGFETQFQGYLTKRWYISAGYSYLEGEITDGNNADEEGNTPQELPENLFSLWNRYQFTDSFGLGLGVIYQDDSFADEDNTVVLPDFVRVDAAVYYKVSENLNLQLNIENLFDEDYFPNAHTNNNITVGAPINARFAISGRF